MPTDAGVTEGDSEQQKQKLKHGLRLALTPWAVFSAGMIWGMPLAFVGAVFAAIFCLDRKPLPVRYGWALFYKSALVMLVALGLSAVLLPYPVVYLVAICVGVLLAYRLQLKSGDLLLSVFAVIAALLRGGA